MSTDLAHFEPNEQSIAQYLGLDPRNPATHAVIAVCQRYDLDPVLKHVIVIPKGGVYITRDGLLHVAHRSGQLDGIVVEQDPTLVDNEWIAKVTVYRKDMRHGFTYPGRYSVSGGNRQYAQEMAMKAAEAHALRRAFDVTGLPTVEEQRPEPAPTTSTGRDRLQAALRPVDVGEVQQHEPDPEPEPVGLDLTRDPITHPQSVKLHALLREQGADNREAGLAIISGLLGREVASTKDLTKAEASRVIDDLNGGEQ